MSPESPKDDERAGPWRIARRNDGAQVPYRREGEGRAILCVPGLGNSSRLFGTLPRTLARLGYCAYVYDPPGLGRASAWHGVWSLEHAQADIAAVLDAEGLEHATLLGTSMGGKVALAFAASEPDRVERAYLYGTEAIGSAHARSVYGFFRAVFTHVPTEELGEVLRPWLFGASFLAEKTALADDILRGFRPSVQERRTTLAQITAIGRCDFVRLLERVEAQVFLHAGLEDALVHAGDIERTAETLPNARFLEVPRAGHSLLLENAEECLRALRR